MEDSRPRGWSGTRDEALVIPTRERSETGGTCFKLETAPPSTTSPVPIVLATQFVW
jgi:hypothetical protein